MCDAGSDNVGATRMICTELLDVPNVGVIAQYCALHQDSLIARSLYDLVDDWKWTGPQQLQCTYITGVSTVVNVWRTPGAWLNHVARFPLSRVISKLRGLLVLGWMVG